MREVAEESLEEAEPELLPGSVVLGGALVLIDAKGLAITAQGPDGVVIFAFSTVERARRAAPLLMSLGGHRLRQIDDPGAFMRSCTQEGVRICLDLTVCDGHISWTLVEDLGPMAQA